jgi:hypothetical protein
MPCKLHTHTHSYRQGHELAEPGLPRTHVYYVCISDNGSEGCVSLIGRQIGIWGQHAAVASA